MKVLIFDFGTTFGGVQQVMVNLFGELQKENPQIAIHCIDGYDEPRTRQLLQERKIQVVSLPIEGPSQLNWDRRNKFAVLFEYGSIYLRYLWQLCRHIRNEGYDVIYAQSKKGLVIAAGAAWLCGIPYIYHAHGFRSERDIRGIFRQAIRNAAAVIGISQDVNAKLLAAGAIPERLHLIYNGVARMAAPPKSYYQSQEQLDLRWAIGASIQEAKGIHVAVAAAASLKQRGIKNILEIYGEPPSLEGEKYLEQLKQQIKDLHLEEVVRFMGWTADIPKAFRCQDVVVLPSYSEGLPMILLEAMSQGLPLIASAVGGVPEIIKDGENGLLVPPGDGEKLADALEILTQNELLRWKMGKAGQKIVEEKFTLVQQAGQLKALLTDTIGLGKA